MTSLFSLAAGFGGQMKIVKAYSAQGQVNTTVAVPALSGSQMAVFMYTVTGGPTSAASGAQRSCGGSVSVSGTNVDGGAGTSATVLYYLNTSGAMGGVTTSYSPVQFVTTSTGSQNLTVSSYWSTDSSYSWLSWNGIMCIYNPPF